MAAQRVAREPSGAPNSPSDEEDPQGPREDLRAAAGQGAAAGDGARETISAFKIAERRENLSTIRQASSDDSGFVAVLCFGVLTDVVCLAALWSARFQPSNATICVLDSVAACLFGGAVLYWYALSTVPIIFAAVRVAVITCEEQLGIARRNIEPILQVVEFTGVLRPFKAFFGFVKPLYGYVCRKLLGIAAWTRQFLLILAIVVLVSAALQPVGFLVYLHFT